GRPVNGPQFQEAFPCSAYPAGAGAGVGLSCRARGPDGVSGTSVERFADSSLLGGVLVGCVGGRLATGLRPAHPEPTKANRNKVVDKKSRIPPRLCASRAPGRG